MQIKNQIIMTSIMLLCLFGCKKPKYKACFAASSDTVSINERVVFTNCSEFDGGLDGCQWTFGDGSQENTFGNASVTHSYQNAGQYTVKLWIGLKEGPADEIEKIVTVIP